MTSSPFLIFLPVRNGGDYVRLALDSIVAQTDPDWRLIVLENGSTDDTVATVRGFDDPRIELLSADRPLDIYANWHRGFEFVQDRKLGNPLMTFIGHDDYFYPNFVARIRALAAEAPDASLYQTLFDLVDSDGGLIRPCRPIAATETWLDLAAAMAWGVRDSFGTGYAFRADDYLKVGGMPYLPRILFADHLMFLRLARLGYKRCDTASGCAYRLHAASTSNNMSGAWMNDRLEAYAGFVSLFMEEFADFVETDLGRAAMTTWIGRELFIFDAPLVRRSFTPANRARLDMLRQRLGELGGRADTAHWSYQVGRRALGVARRAKFQARYLAVLLRSRLARSGG